jgi:two-component system nitrogen regulation response regulator GlnG
MKDQLDVLVHQLLDRGILFGEALAEFEKRFIKKALENHKGNQLRAAKMLGIHRNTLGRKIERYQLDHSLPRR